MIAKCVASDISFHCMPILGHGIDIVETERVRRLVDEHGQRFLDRCFTKDEQQYCARSPKRYYEHLAGRFAAKEAVLKVLGTGWRGGIQWTDVEILKEPSGQPKIQLTGECARIAEQLGIIRWHVSISHIETHATASAIGLRGDAPIS
jgi:holo-[acyl-carrier protein] synthase